jgi:molecular chaperone GrpE
MTTTGQQQPDPSASAAAPDEPTSRAGPDPGGPASADSEAAAESALATLQDQLKRALADLDNLRKRYARELDRERGSERSRVASEWLPVVDNLELALAHGDADPAAVVTGIRAVRDQAVGVLDRLGFPRQEDVGVPFDPALHEVLSVVDAPDAEPGTVVSVLRPGYGRQDRQLRPSTVAVARQPE